MIALVFLLCSLGALVSSDPQIVYDIEDAEQLFEEFIITFDRQYSSEFEKQTRFEIFKRNLIDINEANQREDDAVFGVTQFTDMTPEEKTMMNGFREFETKQECPKIKSSDLSNGTFEAPETLDWRTKNAVTAVKDQKKCGSCWAFSTIGNVEGQNAIVHKKLEQLSEQQLVDCDHHSHGCTGGNMIKAIEYLQGAGGSEAQKDYPYEGKEGKCRFNKSKAKVQIKGCNLYLSDTEDELKNTLAQVGPLAIAIDATSIMEYKGGVMKNCTYDGWDHGVVLVGYGTEKGTPYWLIKNSWGTSWGEQGYLKVQRNVNACGIIKKGGFVVSAVVA